MGENKLAKIISEKIKKNARLEEGETEERDMLLDDVEFFFGELACAVGDLETAFAGAVDQVRRSAQTVTELLVLFNHLQGVGSALVAVFADEGIHLGILTETFHAGSQHQQLTAVGDGHAGAVNGLVAQPGALEFPGVKIDDHLVKALGHMGQIDLLALLDSSLKLLFADLDYDFGLAVFFFTSLDIHN